MFAKRCRCRSHEVCTHKKTDIILDVGCGDGKITAAIAAKVPNGVVVGLDVSPSMIDFARANFPADQHANLQFVLKDAQNLDYHETFDILFSFTAVQWIADHEMFLKKAHESLKPLGTFAITMPMGLPANLEQAVNEKISSLQWVSYFQGFSTGWNFVSEVDYAKLLATNQFISKRFAVVPQNDIFPTRAVFEKFINQWFPYLRPLPQNLKQTFLTEVVDRYLELETFPNDEVHFKVRRLEIVATKT
ncbi:MAG: hypothetical protein CK425_02015 [Parachlamydia sp.]|nr:MAG: hypothetical protein CK425_02015 [Parachlamydia sp.]